MTASRLGPVSIIVWGLVRLHLYYSDLGAAHKWRQLIFILWSFRYEKIKNSLSLLNFMMIKASGYNFFFLYNRKLAINSYSNIGNGLYTTNNNLTLQGFLTKWFLYRFNHIQPTVFKTNAQWLSLLMNYKSKLTLIKSACFIFFTSDFSPPSWQCVEASGLGVTAWTAERRQVWPEQAITSDSSGPG